MSTLFDDFFFLCSFNFFICQRIRLFHLIIQANSSAFYTHFYFLINSNRYILYPYMCSSFAGIFGGNLYRNWKKIHTHWKYSLENSFFGWITYVFWMFQCVKLEKRFQQIWRFQSTKLKFTAQWLLFAEIPLEFPLDITRIKFGSCYNTLSNFWLIYCLYFISSWPHLSVTLNEH